MNHSVQIQKTKISGIPLYAVKYFFAVSFLFLISTTTTKAQLRSVPLQQKPRTINTSTITTLGSADTLDLPFLDDFTSLPYDANGVPPTTPDVSKWKNSTTVWVNNGMAINPPSINVATFDGLDSLYAPYETTQILINGFTDKLESKPINLENVDPAERTSVYLSFFYQWEGNGEPPDPADYLQLDFLNRDTLWEQIERFYPGDTPDNTIFNYVHEKVDSAGQQRFYHKGFQFRLRRFGRKSGPFDTWNVDYVYLDKGRGNVVNSDFNDLAVSSTASALFKPYRAVPLKHFFATKYLDSVRFQASNLHHSDQPADYSAIAYYTNFYANETVTNSSEVLIVRDSIGNDATILANGHRMARLLKLPTITNTKFDSTAVKINVRLKFEVLDDVSFIETNDTVTTEYTIANYYAYDDGIADNSVVLTQPGNSAALQFKTIANRSDMWLKAFDIYFPAYGIENNQTVDLTVYDDNGGLPGKIISRIKTYSIQRKGFNEFSRITLYRPVEVKDVFYIGWTEPYSGKIKVGLDNSNNTGSKIFVSIASTWVQNTDVDGSLMIRPIFGDPGVITGNDHEEENNFATYYPNPCNGTFHIQGKYDHLQIINATGQSISYEVEDEQDNKRITLQSSPGLYFVQLRKGKTERTGKLIIK
jgi:hypothetical protein